MCREWLDYQQQIDVDLDIEPSDYLNEPGDDDDDNDDDNDDECLTEPNEE